MSDFVQDCPSSLAGGEAGQIGVAASVPQALGASARLPIIDVARGGAALMVCAMHALLINWIGLHACLARRHEVSAWLTVLGLSSAPLVFGATAVPLFFVISGYCIHRSFAAKLAGDPEHQPNWRAYFIRRAWRIYPVLMAVIALTFLLDQCTIRQFPHDSTLGSLSLRTMLVNLFALQGLAGPYYGSNGVLWTLSVELQLYAVYPVIFYVIRSRGLDASLGLTAVISLASAAAASFGPLRPFIWFGPYWFCWTLGCAVAELEASKKRVPLEPFKIMVWFVVSALGFALWLGPYRALAFSGVGCFWALIILKCLQAPAANATNLPLLLMSRLGVISYSLYAVHVPVCLFIRSLLFHGSQSSNILVVLPIMAACVLVAAALFFLVERYSLRVPAWLRSPSMENR